MYHLVAVGASLSVCGNAAQGKAPTAVLFKDLCVECLMWREAQSRTLNLEARRRKNDGK